MTAAAVNSVQVEALRLLIDQIDSLGSRSSLRSMSMTVERLQMITASVRATQAPQAVVAAERTQMMAQEAARWLRMMDAELAAVRVGLLQDLQSAKGVAS